ncbi:helix-turn-helix domain-containing protein [Pseudoxanthomonas sacheonensis]|uniref:Transcriptional regulator with XRE-family HTH domain n=1 Tax=Pseudoxanthomonas sacheonensis TaxID=443615 RepID=A0ABU1RQJ1_9GAMM|nr:helix-turn-helix transcriptional regulator [Pseudoxanthomonas sacheonensis]MDR6841022.1 transcriptional regulator with XRE-family HTH domain [Pseudoxanthomonas sacheonensis]
MPAKSIHKAEYQTLLQMLRDIRARAGLTQVELSEALEHSQSYVSDVERGVRRMDLLQLRDYCEACGVRLSTFVKQLEVELR